MPNGKRIALNAGQSFRLFHWSRNLREIEFLPVGRPAERISGCGDRRHHHTEMELTVFTQGEGVLFAGDHIGPLSAGEAVLFGENMPHYWKMRGACAGFSVQWDFPPDHAFWTFPETLALSGLFDKAARGIRYGGRSGAAVTAGLREMARAGGLDRLGQFLRVLAHLANAPASEQTLLSRRPFSPRGGAQHQQGIFLVERYLQANFRDELRLEEVLRISHMSKATFARKFKRHTGKTFSEFVTHLRLQAACRALLETDRTVLEIACSCGFGEISFFNRIFRRQMSCSPSEYRARLRLRPEPPVPMVAGAVPPTYPWPAADRMAARSHLPNESRWLDSEKLDGGAPPAFGP